MKKNVLTICMLLLCIGILPCKTFAQDVPGGLSAGDVGTVDLGVRIGTTTFSAPPSYVKSVKRNNGNATSVGGVAEARLQISNTYSGEIWLIDVTYLDNPGVPLNAVVNGCGYLEKGYFSYALSKNVNPAKKLMFYFQCQDGTAFCIPETN